MKDFSQLKRNLKKDFSDFKTIKLAVLGDTATQFLAQALKGFAYEFGVHLDVWEADFNQIERQVFDAGSELYEFKPDVVLIFKSSHKLLERYNKLNSERYNLFAEQELDQIEQIYTQLNDNLKARIIFYNFPEINDSVFGSFANKIESSFLFQLRKLNYELMNFSAKNINFSLCDLSSIQNQLGKAYVFQPSVYIHSDMVLSIDVLPKVAALSFDLIYCSQGNLKKCVILDLDNTIWGGIIGDDGLENIQIGNLGIGKAFTEFQYWLKKLKNRGIILAVCSKNTESVAKEVFEKHPDMVLHLEDISVFIANWDNKVDNIRQIQSILNIGFDSMVFMDDNPFERNMVRENIPEICVPEMPEDPADYLEFLYELNLFETSSFSNEDKERTKLYQIEAQRVFTQKTFTNVDDFLISLNMLSVVESFNSFNIPRIAQLSQRSNQFNLRTLRYTDEEIKNLIVAEDYFTFSFTLEDKFGDNGLICALILKKENKEVLFVENWFMSCRVLKRGMESFVLNTLVECAKKAGFMEIKGEYDPSSKNEIVKDHYLHLGFEERNGFWRLNLASYIVQRTYISKK